MLGSLISAGASLLGGVMGANRASDAAENAAAFNAQQAQLNRDQQQRMFNRNIREQRTFAQEGLGWRIRDGLEHGIHPLYAVGANPISFSPVSVGGSQASIGADNSGDIMARSISGMGQDLGRAVDAIGGQTDRMARMLQLENMGLQNDLLRSQIARNAAQIGPPAPAAERFLVDGQPDSGRVNMVPLQVNSVDPANHSSEAGAVPEVGYAIDRNGNYAITQSKDAHDRLEDDLLGQIAWAYRNRILPMVGANTNPPSVKAPEGTEWVWSGLYQSYVPKKHIIGPFYW